MDDYQDAQQEAYAHELAQERYRMNVDALRRCAACGASVDDLKHLAMECGVDPKHITIGANNASH